jgi:hypothetical protein
MELSIKYKNDIIHTTIDNHELLDYFTISDTKEEYMLQLIEVGFKISQCMIPSTSACSCSYKIDKITSILEPFNTGGNSSKNGLIGELFASEEFMKRNNHIVYQDTSKIDRSGDAILTVSNHLIDKIMVDYKNYNTPVPSDETSKLVRDLHTQNIDYGILISYKSKISNRGYIDYDIIDGKLIVFVAAYGMNIFTLEVAIQFLQKLHECHILSISQQVSELVVRGVMRTITELYESIFKIASQHTQHIHSMKDNLDKIQKMFHGMISDGEKTLIHINVLKDKVNHTMKELNQESSTNIHSYTELIDYIDQYIDKGKDKLLAKRLINMTRELNILGFYSGADNCIHFNKIGKLQLTKSKITMIFYNHSDEDTTYNRKYETMKYDNYYIVLSDEPMKWTIINHRFTH